MRRLQIWRPSWQINLYQRFNFIPITFHKASASSWRRYLNIPCWGVSQELDISNKSGSSWDPTVLFPGTQSHNTSGPGTGWYHLGQHHLDYDITLSTVNTLMISLLSLPSLLICHWLILKKTCRASIDMRSFKCILEQSGPWPLWVWMTRIKMKVEMTVQLSLAYIWSCWQRPTRVVWKKVPGIEWSGVMRLLILSSWSVN